MAPPAAKVVAMPRTRAQQALFDRSSELLREAEALASISGVSGPADSYEVGAEDSFLSDWKQRARRALDRAQRLITAPQRALAERGMQVAKRVVESGRALRRASKEAYEDSFIVKLLSWGSALTAAAGVGSIVLTAILAYAAYRLFISKR
jgi:hypothetical protein